MLSSNDPYHPEHLLHRAGKFFRSILGVHRIIKAAYSPEYRKISINAALIKGRGIFCYAPGKGYYRLLQMIKENINKYYKGFEICEKLTVYHCGHVYALDGRCIAEVAAHKAFDK